MLVRRTPRAAARRKGVILLVVLALLTLFAILGLSFVSYSDAEATSARIYRETQSRASNGGGDLAVTLPEAAGLWANFLGQLIYDLDDDSYGAYSVLRGHSLARTMYGWDDTAGALNDKPYAGTGRLRETVAGIPFAETELAVNYQFGPGKVLRDPGRLGARTQVGNPRGALTGDLHVSYTYADHNHMFLAVLDPATGDVVLPSYHRPWIGGALTAANPNWTADAGRYLLMRPRPVDMGTGFPMPASASGDVSNLDRERSTTTATDSIWIDINSPVQVAPDGRKYKMLIAPCIIELDGRININTAGNLMATLAGGQAAHASNQGWGPWEVNPEHLLNATTTGQPPEWHKLLLGDGGAIAGRYGNTYPNATAVPQGTAVTPGSIMRGYYPADYNGIIDRLPAPAPANAGQLSPRFLLPQLAAGGARAWQLFPSFAPLAYKSGVPNETPNHASIYNVQRPQGDNRAFEISDLVSLLRRLDSSAAASSELLELLPQNLQGSGPLDAAALARCNRITTHSFDLDRSGSPPYVWDPNSANAAERYRYDPATGVATAAAQPFPPLTNRTGVTPPVGSEFDANWRNILAVLPRIDLVRKLTDYPPTNVAAGWQYTAAQRGAGGPVQQALADRQQLASELFERLLRVTGAVPRSTWPPAAGGYAVTSPEFQAVRWLAQLAANIVDFVDNDDFSTPFNFHTGQWVFGTEMPRLVLNETYAQWDNDPVRGLGTAAAQNTYRVNLWAELHNPFPRESVVQDALQGDVRLHNGTYPIYRLLVCRGPNANIRAAENFLGSPDAPANVVATVADWGPENAAANLNKRLVQGGTSDAAGDFAQYAGVAGENQGYYVVGPMINDAGGMPTISPYNAALAGTRPFADAMPTFRSAGMSFESDLTINPTGIVIAGMTQQRPSLLLQRLANPYLPEQPNPALPEYNPFLTIDYVEQVNVVDGRQFDTAGLLTPVAVGLRAAQGRWHPFTAARWLPQEPIPAVATSPKHTFFRANGQEATAPTASATQTMQVPFDVLTHPDRQVNSVAELLHVSGFKPHELTQQFIDAAGNRFRHRAAWTRQDTRLYRLWDHLTVRSRAAGVALGGRVPGKVNINAVRDNLTLRAIADANGTSNHFTQVEVDAIWALLSSAALPATPTSNARPFKSLGAGYATAADGLTHWMAPSRGIQETLLRNFAGTATLTSDTAERRALEPTTMVPASDQPLRRFELLAKISGQLTTRSHVFGVWATVGFFEVLDDTVQPAQLGTEMQWPVNGVIRHRMFAVIDRSNLQVWPTYDANNNPVARLQQAVTVPAGQQAVTAPVTLLNAAGAATTTITHPYIQPARTWTLQANAVLTIDPDTDNEETVVVRPRAGGGFEATFAKSHAADAVVISRGNPGPWRNYDPAHDLAVVPFQTVLE